MAWVGGKKALREEVLARFPLYYERYIEVFGGGGWVLFHKPPGTDFEVYNDLNGNLAALYRAVRDHPRELQERLRYVLNSREDFMRLKQVLEHPEGMEEVARAAAFYQVIRYSYAAGCGSFAAQPHSMWGNFPLIDKACARLQKVVVENKDFEKLIRQYDRPVSFFYCDPPYVDTEDYYSNITFGRGGHERLRDTLLSVQGKFLLSYNDHPLVWEMYDRPGIYIERVTRLNNMKAYTGYAQRGRRGILSSDRAREWNGRPARPLRGKFLCAVFRLHPRRAADDAGHAGAGAGITQMRNSSQRGRAAGMRADADGKVDVFPC